MPNEQLAPGASVVPGPHPPVLRNSGVENVMSSIVRLPDAAALRSVTICTALLLPSGTLPKSL